MWRICVSLCFSSCQPLLGMSQPQKYTSMLPLPCRWASIWWLREAMGRPDYMAQYSTTWWMQSVSPSPRPWGTLSWPVLQQATHFLSFKNANSYWALCIRVVSFAAFKECSSRWSMWWRCVLVFLMDGAFFNTISMSETVFTSPSVQGLEKMVIKINEKETLSSSCVLFSSNTLRHVLPG